MSPPLVLILDVVNVGGIQTLSLKKKLTDVNHCNCCVDCQGGSGRHEKASDCREK